MTDAEFLEEMANVLERHQIGGEWFAHVPEVALNRLVALAQANDCRNKLRCEVAELRAQLASRDEELRLLIGAADKMAEHLLSSHMYTGDEEIAGWRCIHCEAHMWQKVGAPSREAIEHAHDCPVRYFDALRARKAGS